MSHTFATLEVEARCYDHIAKLLDEAGYGHALVRTEEPPLIDMHGIGLKRKSEPVPIGANADGDVVFRVTSKRGAFAVKTAVMRAAFHLKKQGYGKDDADMADILEQLNFTVLED